MLKVIIFDWDDVFTIGSKDGYFACYHETLVDLGVSMSPKEEKKEFLLSGVSLTEKSSANF